MPAASDIWAGPAREPRPVPRVTNAEDAGRLVGDVLATLSDLEKILSVETAHIRVGRIRDGLAQEARKTAMTDAYLRGLEAVKANAVALARFTPDAVERLRAAHAEFAKTIETNQVVLATARAVSESVVKGIAEEMNRSARPQTYAPASATANRPAGSTPLVLSKSC